MCDTSDALRSETIWHLYFSGLCIIEQFVRNELPSENSTNQNRHQPSLDERFANRPRLRTAHPNLVGGGFDSLSFQMAIRFSRTVQLYTIQKSTSAKLSHFGVRLTCHTSVPSVP